MSRVPIMLMLRWPAGAKSQSTLTLECAALARPDAMLSPFYAPTICWCLIGPYVSFIQILLRVQVICFSLVLLPVVKDNFIDV